MSKIPVWIMARVTPVKSLALTVPTRMWTWCDPFGDEAAIGQTHTAPNPPVMCRRVGTCGQAACVACEAYAQPGMLV